MRKKCRIFLFFFLNSYALFAQTPFISDEELLEKLTSFHKANPKDRLFVHTDKAIYTNGEQLWFSAYLVQSLATNPQEHNVLSMALMREDNRKIYREDKYAMENGLGFGSFILPDTLPPGNYQVLFSTNLLDKSQKPIAQFAQHISVTTINQVSFDARLSLLDSIPRNGEVKVKVAVEFKEEDRQLNSVPRVSYHLARGQVRTKKLDKNNSIVLTIPVEELNDQNPVLLTSISCRKEVQHLSIKLPEVRIKGLKVRFFPEGGDLVNGLESTIAWETKTTADLPIPLTGILFKDDQPVDTLSTNSYGVGTFRLVASRGSRYRIEVKKNDYLASDTSYNLPVVLEDGVILNLENGVVNDTLALRLSAGNSRRVKVFIHDFRNGYSSFHVQLQPSSKRTLIALPAVPRGLAAVTVMDEEGKPLAERLFFAHHNQGVKMEVAKSEESYKKREQVTLKFRLKDATGDRIPGIVSVACVQEGRLDDFKQQDIETYSLLSDLAEFPLNPSGNLLNDQAYLENVLLVRGWRRYSWQGIMNTAILSDTSQTIQSLKIRGNALYNNRSLKKAVKLNVIRDGQFDVIETAPNGDFDFAREHLLTMFGRKVLVMVDKQNRENYSIEIDDPYKELNEKFALAAELAPTYGFLKTEQSSEEYKMRGFENAIALKEVVVKGRINELVLKPLSNPCGDYVCMYGILNCSNHYGHFNNSLPVKGHRYAEGVVYSGCFIYEEVKPVSQIDGIYTTREFYGVDPKLFDFPDPQQLSTLYWKPGLVINKDGEAECSFYTGDIAGKFRVVVQGVGSNELIYGQESFEVR